MKKKVVTVLRLLRSTNKVFLAAALMSVMTASIYAAQKEAAPKKRSAESREESDILFTGSPVGFYIFPGASINAGAVIDGHNTAEAGYTSTTSNLSGTSALLNNYVDVRWRLYLGNSFNVKLGPGYRRTRINYHHEKASGSHYNGVYAISSSVGPMVTIGNQWQFNNFIIGCEWVGFYVPAFAVDEGKLHGDLDSLSSSDRAKIKRDAKGTNMGRDLFLLAFHMGFAF